MPSLFEAFHDISEDARGSKVSQVFYMSISHMLASAATGHKYCFVMADQMPFVVSSRDLNKVRKAFKRHGLQVTKMLGDHKRYFRVSWEDNADLES